MMREALILVKNAGRDLPSLVNKRQEFAELMSQARRRVVPSRFWGEPDTIVSIGGGHGENPYYLAKDIPSVRRIIIIEPIAKIARYIENNIEIIHIPKRFQDITSEDLELFGNNFIWEISNVFQTVHMAGKKEIIDFMREHSREGQKGFFVDERPRENAGGTIDEVCNFIFNPDQLVFDRISVLEYIKLFGQGGFVVGEIEEYGRDLVAFSFMVA